MSPRVAPPRSGGFAMGIVIAVLVVFGILGTALVVISTTQQVGLALDTQGVRAYHAARGGVEWGLYHVLRTGFGGCAGINGKVITFGGNLAGFRAALTCTSTAHEEGGTTVTVFDITANACNDGATCPTAASPPPAAYVERELRVAVAR